MGTGFRRDLHPSGFGVPDKGNRAFGTHMADVDGRANGSSRGNFPGGAAILRSSGDAGDSQTPGNFSLIHQPTGGKVQVLAVGSDHHSQLGRLFQGFQQAPGIHHRAAVIAEGNGPCFAQSRQVRELLSLQVLGDTGSSVHMGIGRFRPFQQGFHGFR